MQEVVIVTDSISCLTRELMEQYNITIVPVRLLFQGKVYRDSVDITASEAYEMFLQDPASFTTSPASPGHFLEAYHEASKLGKHILCITLSSRLSTGCDMARVAREQAKGELPEASIEVLDSQNVTAAEGFIALEAARAAAEGRSLVEVTKVAEKTRDKVSFLIVLETIRYVYRTGRIPKIAAQAASLLNIRPILTSSSGLIRFVGAVRNKEQGINRIIQLMEEKVGQAPVRVAVMHAYAPDEAEKLKGQLLSKFNCAELWVTEFSPVMGYACGTGAVGFAFLSES